MLRDRMRAFRVRDRVRVEGYNEVFAVMYVNAALTWADLACLQRVGFLTHVPLEKMAHIEMD
jgi:hypothetical protein